MLPDGSVFVNVARGALVDETALMTALDCGKLSAAGLDCFVTKPGGNPALAGYDNVFMLPHIGSSNGARRDAMGFWPLDNLVAFLPESSRATCYRLPPLAVSKALSIFIISSLTMICLCW